MSVKFNIMARTLLILVLSLLLATELAVARNKNVPGNKQASIAKPADFGETVIAIGKIKNYFTNSTVSNRTGQEEFTFIIGNENNQDLSGVWLEGGYPNNSYLYVGNCRFGVNGNEARFTTYTSNDWTVKINDPAAVSPYDVSFSVTDEYAGNLKIGLKAKQSVHAWSESYRDDFYIIEYDVTNTGSGNITDFYAWLHMDCDISTAGGGSDALAYSRDDLVGYYIGTDKNGKPEYLSYMYDGDNPNIPGDDTGGNMSPKESLGYIGSRVLECPPRTGDATGVTANTQSGHQWWDWNSDPQLGGDFYNLAAKQEFKPDPGSPHDYRYMQILGPFTINSGDSIHFAFGFGIGEGLAGLRSNLQWSYDLYWNDFHGPAAPTAPTVTLQKGDGVITLYWNDISESSLDPLSGEQDFEGYRVYRSLDKTTWTLLADFDLVDNLGLNTGLPAKNAQGLYQYVDKDVTNGFLYYYTVAAYDKGSADLPSLETGKITDVYAEPGPLPTAKLEKDKIRVVPNPFVVKAPWDFTPTQENPSEERIQFQNIPKGSKVTVFNLAGDEIITLHQSGNDGYVNWDLITKNTQKVVSGLYLYVVESGTETFVDKFVIVR
jgi:hypothetical protein